MSSMERADKVVSLFLKTGPQVKELPLDKIIPRANQPRKKFDMHKITELAESIRDRGVLQPIRVRSTGSEKYEIIAGERRWRASNLLGLKTIPAVIAEGLKDVEVMAEALIENIQREDLSSFEKSMAIKDLMDCQRALTNKKMSLESVGKMLGLSRQRVCQYLNILKLPEGMLESFCSSEMNEMHARALLMLKERKEHQQNLFREIEECGLTGQQAVEWAKQYIKDIPDKTPISNLVKSSNKQMTNLKKKWTKMDALQQKNCREQLLRLMKEIRITLKELEKPGN